jgi:hypothetical protein
MFSTAQTAVYPKRYPKTIRPPLEHRNSKEKHGIQKKRSSNPLRTLAYASQGCHRYIRSIQYSLQQKNKLHSLSWMKQEVSW